MNSSTHELVRDSQLLHRVKDKPSRWMRTNEIEALKGWKIPVACGLEKHLSHLLNETASKFHLWHSDLESKKCWWMAGMVESTITHHTLRTRTLDLLLELLVASDLIASDYKMRFSSSHAYTAPMCHTTWNAQKRTCWCSGNFVHVFTSQRGWYPPDSCHLQPGGLEKHLSHLLTQWNCFQIPPLAQWSGSQEMLMNGRNGWIYNHSSHRSRFVKDLEKSFVTFAVGTAAWLSKHMHT